MSVIKQLGFFPFSMMTKEMVAQFCAEHLIMYGAISSCNPENNHKLRELMNNIKNKRYSALCQNGTIDAFIIN